MNLRYERNKPIRCNFSNDTKIIWASEETETYYDTPKNSYCLFRKEISIEDSVQKATLRIFADTRYIFYINGKRVGRGPCRSDPRWQYFDTYDIEKYFTKGKNILSAEVLYYGYGTGHSISRIPTLFAECIITFENANTLTVSTDKRWKVFLSNSLNRNAPRVNGCKGCIEIWNMQKALNFTSPDFDDSKWQYAKEREVCFSPFWNLCPKGIENINEEYVKCDSVIAKGIGECHPGLKVDEMHKQLKAELSELEMPNFTKIEDTVYKQIENNNFNYAVLDFKRILAGYISINLNGNDGDIVDVIYSEELLNGKPVFDNISYRPFTRFILKNGENILETKFSYEAFRYVYLFFRNYSGDIKLNNVGITTRNYPLREVSIFNTKDEGLQKLWDISVHTLKLCMQDGFLDSPSREQQQWMGDGRFQAIMNYYYSGDCKMHEKLLLQIAQSQDLEGLTCSRYPDANHNWPPIPSFCLQWICSFGDYYKFTQKTGLIASLWNSIIAAMRWFSGFENSVGILEDIRYWQYYDLSKNDDGWVIDCSLDAPNAFINLMYAEAMKAVIDLARVLNDDETVKFFSAKFDRLKKSIIDEFWNDCVGAYSVYKEKVLISEAVNALAIIVLHNKDDVKALNIISNVFDIKTCVSGVYRVSPYFMIPFYRAMNKMDRNDIALSETVKRYSLMLEGGATSTWEHWKLIEGNFMHSACHAWAASPIVLIAENLLGINVAEMTDKKSSFASGLKNFDAKIVTQNTIYQIISNENGVQFHEENRI